MKTNGMWDNGCDAVSSRNIRVMNLDWIGRAVRAVVATAMLFMIAPVAVAQDLLLFGYETASDKGSYSSVGYIWKSRSERKFLDKLSYRLWLDNVEYEYDKGDSTIFANGPGLTLAFSYGEWSEDFSWGAGLGLNYRNLSLSQPDPESSSVGAHTRLSINGEVRKNFGLRFGVKAAMTITPSNDGYWTKFQAFRRFRRTSSYGVELSFAGDSSYDQRKIGLTLNGLQLGKSDWVLSLAAGRKGDDEFDETYAGLSLLKLFN